MPKGLKIAKKIGVQGPFFIRCLQVAYVRQPGWREGKNRGSESVSIAEDIRRMEPQQRKLGVSTGSEQEKEAFSSSSSHNAPSSRANSDS